MRPERSPRPASRLRLGSRPEEIEAAIQDRLAALADIDMRFEVGCRGLRRSVLPRSMKAFFLRQMRLRRRLQRISDEAALAELRERLLRLASTQHTLH
jgi:hypothetical protein